jgi:hypothetical protein
MKCHYLLALNFTAMSVGSHFDSETGGGLIVREVILRPTL